MPKNRQELLQILISKFVHALKSMHTGQSFTFGDFRLNRQQVMILFFIAESPEGVAVKDLAKFLQVTSGAVTQFIDILVTHKLVKRQEGLSDRRLSRIKLSPFAQTQFKKFKTNYLISASGAFKDFEDEELQQFIKLVEKIKS